ncbi:MAG: UvrB/UvrC motif-containing protein, partial [Candidatus Omnitrophica bacterium]|nr:UvrB/UvrC motif-containing protein [Candidatus Omnitrophota bacterium]
DTVDVFLAYEERALRAETEFDEIRALWLIDPVTGERLRALDRAAVYPAKHFVTTEERVQSSLELIESELVERVKYFNTHQKFLEAQRIEQRTRYDMEMMRELGYCSGIENYSRYLSGREPGSRPYCLLDYFPEDYLVIIDESHVTLPQIRGMYHGDRSRKETLVEYGFRLPCALDNRPLTFEEFESMVPQAVFVSATPGEYEQRSSRRTVEQVIRPTGLLDPSVEIRPTEGQVDDLIAEVTRRALSNERVLVTTLTKRMSEDLCRYFEERGIRVKYLHSEIDAIQRVEILKSLRMNEFDCLIGINLLREGLDLPEVSLVAILDADKEGFLRSATALIQTAGRAARHVAGHVILYADRRTAAMDQMIRESDRRRIIQLAYNSKHGVVPQSIQKEVRGGIEEIKKIRMILQEAVGQDEKAYEQTEAIEELESQMEAAAKNLQFERAILLRDRIREIRASMEKERP